MLTMFVLILAYLLGSLSSAIIVCRLLKLADPRSDGSGNPGATNVLRLAGKKAAALVFVGDLLKGVFAILLGKIFGLAPFPLAWVMVAVLLGHVFPVFFAFKGGKGVATVGGALLMLVPPIGVTVIGVWVVVALVTRYSSLAALIAGATSMFMALFFGHPAYLIAVVTAIGILTWRHMENIERLLDGEESKMKLG